MSLGKANTRMLDGNEFINWESTYTTVQSNSATWEPQTLSFDEINAQLTVSLGNTVSLSSLSGGGGGGNWSLIGTTTISGSPSVVDFSLTGSHRKYMFEFEDVVSATAYLLNMRTSSDGGTTFDSGSTDYTYGGGAQATYGPTYAQAGFIRLTGSVSTAANRGIYGELIIYDPFGTTRHKRVESKLSRTLWNDANSMDIDIWAGARRTTLAVNAIRFYFSSGNFVNGGKIRLFGWNE